MKIVNNLFFICFLFSAICEAQWQPDVRLTNAPGNSYTSLNNDWCVAANGIVVHVVWSDSRDGNPEIYYKRSTDAGINWGADIRLTNNTASSVSPSIVVYNSNVHIGWKDNRDGNDEIYYKHSTDEGITWGVDTRLTNNSYSSWGPSIALSGPNIHIVWRDNRDGNYEIYYIRSTDSGITWGADTRLTNDSANSWHPSIAVSGLFINVVWRDERDNYWSEIYYKRSTDGGITWEADTRLTNNTAYSYSPSIAVSGTVVHVVWQDDRDDNFEIYYKRSTDRGITWGADTRLTNYNSSSNLPNIAISNSYINVVWQDYVNGNWEIYYKCSIDGGTTWEADSRLTNDTSESWYPSIAVSGSNLHVIWHDYRDGNWEIYYKRNPSGNPTGIQNISTETSFAYSLEQNYPNPFNPNTNIKFSIPENGKWKTENGTTTLKIFDLLGREISTLVNERLQPGTYSVDFDGTNYPSGIYFYRLQINSFTETKRMILIK